MCRKVKIYFDKNAKYVIIFNINLILNSMPIENKKISEAEAAKFNAEREQAEKDAGEIATYREKHKSTGEKILDFIFRSKDTAGSVLHEAANEIDSEMEERKKREKMMANLEKEKAEKRRIDGLEQGLKKIE